MKIGLHQIWDTDGRKGKLSLRLLESINTDEDAFFKAEIVSGTARFISDAYKLAQKADGLGTEGTVLSFRTTLTTFITRRKDLERRLS